MKITNKFLLLIFSAGLLSVTISAQSTQPGAPAAASKTPGGDPRLTKALDQAKTKYRIDPQNGLFVVAYETKNKRSQNVLIEPKVEKINGVEMRLIFSFAFFTDQPIAAQTANLLLQKNAESVGYWAVHKLPDGKYAVVNQLYVLADLDGERLELALLAITSLADEMEEQLSKKDEF